jgi:hypothetical protein
VAVRKLRRRSPEIEARVGQFVQQPHVTVNVDDVQAVVVSFLGEVSKVGSLTSAIVGDVAASLWRKPVVRRRANRSRIPLRKTPRFSEFGLRKDLVENRGGAPVSPQDRRRRRGQ